MPAREIIFSVRLNKCSEIKVPMILSAITRAMIKSEVIFRKKSHSTRIAKSIPKVIELFSWDMAFRINPLWSRPHSIFSFDFGKISAFRKLVKSYTFCVSSNIFASAVGRIWIEMVSSLLWILWLVFFSCVISMRAVSFSLVTLPFWTFMMVFSTSFSERYSPLVCKR